MRLRLWPLLLCCLALGCSYARRTVCVLDYEVISNEPRDEYLGSAIPEFLTSELSNTPRLLVQDPQEAMRHWENLQERWTLRDYTRLQNLGLSLGTDYIVLGSVTRLGDNYILESRLFSVDIGSLVPGTAFRRTCFTERDILLQVPSIADQLRYQILARTAAAPAGL